MSAHAIRARQAPGHAQPASRVGVLSGFTVLFGAGLREILRTWRIVVLPAVLLFFAVSGPVIAVLTKQLLESVLGSSAGVPDPTALDSWAQWAKNLGQLGLPVLVVALGGIVAAERRAGIALLILTKPVSHAAYVLAKFCATALLVVVSSVAGALITAGLTMVLFSGVDVVPLIRSTLLWLLLSAMMIAIMICLSAFLPAAAASGAGFGVVIVLSLMGLWGPAADTTPAGVIIAMSTVATGGAGPHGWAIATTIAATVAALAVGSWAVKRMQL
jgi:ABC-2 type transport system permease protein